MGAEVTQKAYTVQEVPEKIKQISGFDALFCEVLKLHFLLLLRPGVSESKVLEFLVFVDGQEELRKRVIQQESG